MDVILHADLRGFADLALPLFHADPVRNTIGLTVLTGLLGDEDIDPGVVMITVRRDGRTVGAALRTPPWPLIVSALPHDTHEAIAEFLVREGIAPGGMSGPRDVVDPFLTLWTDLTGQRADHTVALRLHRLVELVPPTVPGRFRPAAEADIAQLGTWWDEFEAESHTARDGEIDGEREVRRAFANGVRRFVVWCSPEGEPVAMAGASPPLSGTSRVGPVYTARAHRGRGYGSAVTAAATQWALDQGAEDVLLFTDLANPVSNAIYRRIGYRPVLEAVEHRVRDANTLDL